MRMKRRKEREFILKVLYAHEYNSIPYTEIISNLASESKIDITAFIKQVLDKCTNEPAEIDKYFLDRLQNWDIKRVAIMDKLLLRMAIVEFLYCTDIPPEVTINEMIEISKSYSTDGSGKFLNGILDAVLNDAKKKNKLNKTGRGLNLPSD